MKKKSIDIKRLLFLLDSIAGSPWASKINEFLLLGKFYATSPPTHESCDQMICSTVSDMLTGLAVLLMNVTYLVFLKSLDKPFDCSALKTVTFTLCPRFALLHRTLSKQF